MATSIPTRRVYLLLIYAACLLPAIVYGAQRVLHTNKNSPFDWVPASFAPRRQYEEFRRDFGSGEVLVVSWPGSTVDSPVLANVVANLRRTDLFRSNDGEPYVEEVVSGQDALRDLMAEPLELSRKAALARIRGTLVGPDGATTCAIVTLTPAGRRDRERVVEVLTNGLTNNCRVPANDLHFAGPVIDGLTVDQASNDSLDHFAIPSAVAVFLVCWWWLRWLPGALVVLGVSVYCEAATMALVHWCGGEMSALLIVLPPLVQVVTASGGIHLINYYLVAVQSYDAENAAWGAVKIGWLPCSLSGLTTAIGLGSLAVSQLSPVRMFGLFGAMGVVLTFAIVLAFVPGILSIWKPKGIARSAKINLEDGTFEGSSPFWTWLSGRVARHHGAIVVGCVLLMLVMGGGIPWLRSSVHLKSMFGPESRILRDYAWIEQHVGALVPFEVVVEFQAGSPLSPADRFFFVDRVQRDLRGCEHVRGTMSCVNLMPDLPLEAGANDPEVRRILDAALPIAAPELVKHHYLHEAQARQAWRATAFVSALEEIDYAELLGSIRERLAAEGLGDNATAGIAVRLTGVMPLVHEIQRALMQDLFASFLSAFGIIFIIMTIVQAGIGTAAVSMIPNFFPMVLMFGLLGWIGTPLDVGTVMTASIALGIAVDDVLHFLTFYNRGLARGMSREEAIHATYQQCGFAMFTSSMVCGLGPLVFALSDFLPTARFAWMMLLLLTIAVLGDLVLLPALVVGPLGKLFERQHARPKLSAAPRPEESTRREPNHRAA
jgi:hypothetical protein